MGSQTIIIICWGLNNLAIIVHLAIIGHTLVPLRFDPVLEWLVKISTNSKCLIPPMIRNWSVSNIDSEAGSQEKNICSSLKQIKKSC